MDFTSDPVIFPGDSIERLSHYVDFIRTMQSGNLIVALDKYDLNMITYAQMIIKWGERMNEDHELMAKYDRIQSKKH